MGDIYTPLYTPRETWEAYTPLYTQGGRRVGIPRVVYIPGVYLGVVYIPGVPQGVYNRVYLRVCITGYTSGCGITGYTSGWYNWVYLRVVGIP